MDEVTLPEQLGMLALTEWMLSETAVTNPDWLHLLIWLSGQLGALCWLTDPLAALGRTIQEQ